MGYIRVALPAVADDASHATTILSPVEHQFIDKGGCGGAVGFNFCQLKTVVVFSWKS